MRTAAAGFTLLQTLLAITIVGLLIAMALPAFTGATASTHAMAARSAMIESLMKSSTHALLTMTHVVLCPSSDGEACRQGIDWSHGWLAYADLDGDRERGAAEPLLHRQPALDGQVRLLSTPGRTRLVFQPRGDNAGSNVTFTLCDGRGASRATTLVLANSGRWRSSKPSREAAQACADGG